MSDEKNPQEREQRLKSCAKSGAVEKENKERGVFGRLLRFWRTTLEMTQEELAWKAGTSFRHVNFLEAGRSQPGRDMVINLAEALNLSPRDINNLLAAAGLLPKHPLRSLPIPEQDFLKKSLINTLRSLDPHPTIVMDPYTNIQMMNKAFLRLLREFIKPELIQEDLNGYHLLFSDEHLQSYILHWEELACLQLMALQQEVILNRDPVAQKILDALLAYPDIPTNWQRRAVELGKGNLSFENSFTLRHGYQVSLRHKDNFVRNYFTMMTTVGSATTIEPRVLMYTLYPETGVPLVSIEELARDESLEHPLLPY